MMQGSEIRCLLCSKTLISVPEIRVHLFSKLHQERTEQYDAAFDIDRYLPEKDNASYFHQSFDDTTSVYSEF